jgi:hypothetical protein
VQCRPEAVSRPGKVVARGPGIESGIDAAEQHLEMRSDQIRNRATYGSRNLGLGGPRAARCTVDHVQSKMSRMVRKEAAAHAFR